MKLKKAIVKYGSIPVATGLLTVSTAFPVFASETTVVTATDWAPVITELTKQVNVSGIIAALATFVAAGIGLCFMWWGLRKGLRSLMAAFRKGKMSI